MVATDLLKELNRKIKSAKEDLLKERVKGEALNKKEIAEIEAQGRVLLDNLNNVLLLNYKPTLN